MDYIQIFTVMVAFAVSVLQNTYAHTCLQFSRQIGVKIMSCVGSLYAFMFACVCVQACEGQGQPLVSVLGMLLILFVCLFSFFQTGFPYVALDGQELLG